eukprot:3941337-Rhodomonas_salina.1
MVLRRYGMSGTDLGYGATSKSKLHVWEAVPPNGTTPLSPYAAAMPSPVLPYATTHTLYDVRYGHTLRRFVLRLWYGLSGTELGYGATR